MNQFLRDNKLTYNIPEFKPAYAGPSAEEITNHYEEIKNRCADFTAEKLNGQQLSSDKEHAVLAWDIAQACKKLFEPTYAKNAQKSLSPPRLMDRFLKAVGVAPQMGSAISEAAAIAVKKETIRIYYKELNAHQYREDMQTKTTKPVLTP